jgi:hypothetical protein
MTRAATAVLIVGLLASGCSKSSKAEPVPSMATGAVFPDGPSYDPSGTPSAASSAASATTNATTAKATTTAAKPPAPGGGAIGILHTGIVSTTFWVGEIFDASAADGSQMISTYDGSWFAHFGGCDGISASGACKTEKRTAANGYFPTSMTPKENPFYLDLPYDDVNDSTGFKNRCAVIPWANDPGYAGHCNDESFSYMKNRWVKLIGPNGNTCYGQIQDAGPAIYHDSAYVFGSARPASGKFNNAGMDVSPALNGCLGFSELDGQSDKVSWQFVSSPPSGPWTRIVTTRQVSLYRWLTTA